MPILKPRNYRIRAVSGNRPIGVSDDTPDGRRSVKALAPNADAPIWVIKGDVNIGFTISLSDDNPAVDNIVNYDNDGIWSLPEGGPRPTLWKIDAQAHHGKNVYTIVDRDHQEKGWFSNKTSEDDQVKCQLMIVGPSFPPFYPEPERFLLIEA